MKSLLLVVILCGTACTGGPRVTLYGKSLETLDQVNAQNDAIAGSISNDKPIHAAGIKNNSETVEKILKVGANKEALQLLAEFKIGYDRKVALLEREWEDAKTAYSNQISENNRRVDAAEKEAASMKWWLGFAGVIAGVAAAARVAVNLGFPLGGLGTRIVSFIGGLGNAPERIKNLSTLVKGTDEANKELKRTENELNKLFEGGLKDKIKELTDGKYESLTDLWKSIAQAYTVDNNNRVGAEAELKKLRDSTPTSELADKKVS